MKKFIYPFIVLFIISLFFVSCKKEELKPFSAAFYNVENLFDTIDNPKIRDNNYLPTSKVAWNTVRYNKKLNHLSRVMSSINGGGYPSIFGLAEVENLRVLKDLINTHDLKNAHYKILHKDSPDKRGIDVALLYQPSVFKPIKTQYIPIQFPSNPEGTTRDILYSKGMVYGMDTIHVFVNHWVSRYGGRDKTDPLRRYTGKLLRLICDSIFSIDPKANILIMGDLNDDPTDASIANALQAKKPTFPVASKQLYNLADIPFKNGKGSLYYKSWNLFDQMIVSSSLLGGSNGMKVESDSEKIFKKKWMLYKRKNGVMVPSRTASGGRYFGGYSDHLPVIIYIKVDLSGKIYHYI